MKVYQKNKNLVKLHILEISLFNSYTLFYRILVILFLLITACKVTYFRDFDCPKDRCGHSMILKCVYIAYYPFHIMKDYKNIDNLVKA